MPSKKAKVVSSGFLHVSLRFKCNGVTPLNLCANVQLHGLNT